jgi:glycosyltransferase involved in cell wall biosynthesis
MTWDVLVDMTALDTSSRFFGTGRYIAELGSALHELTDAERGGLSLAALTALEGNAPVGGLDWKGSPELVYRHEEELRWLNARRTKLVGTLRRLRPRLFHATYSLGTPRGSFVPRVVNCHDILRLVLHEDYLKGRWVYRHLLHGAEMARFLGARRVLALSKYTAEDMMRLLRVPASRIDIVYPGVDHRRFRAPTAEELPAQDAVLARYGLKREGYLFHLGAADPRKNVDTLIHGFARAKLDGLELALVGKLRPADQTLVDRAIAESGARGVRALGFVPDEDLPAVLAGGLMHPFTSSYEGFGLPPLDAMACGCPVIATGATSIAEVVGDAAILVPPRDPDALAAAMRRVATEPTLREDLRRAGFARAARFTWRETALACIDSYRTALR